MSDNRYERTHVFKEHFAKGEEEASWKFEEFNSRYQTLKEYTRQGEFGEALHNPAGLGLLYSFKSDGGSDQITFDIMNRINMSRETSMAL